jgi:hypothetical protein
MGVADVEAPELVRQAVLSLNGVDSSDHGAGTVVPAKVSLARVAVVAPAVPARPTAETVDPATHTTASSPAHERRRNADPSHP